MLKALLHKTNQNNVIRYPGGLVCVESDNIDIWYMNPTQAQIQMFQAFISQVNQSVANTVWPKGNDNRKGKNAKQ